MSSSLLSTSLSPLGSGVSSLPTRLFGTDGIRGRVGDWLTPSLAIQVGFWTGQVLQQSAFSPIASPAIVLGQDSRISSPGLAQALATGLRSSGVEVWSVGLCPTPAIAYLAHCTEAIGGIMVSASHNPPEDNGIKIFDAQGIKLNRLLQDAIEVGIQESFDSFVNSVVSVGNHPLSPIVPTAQPQLLHRYEESLLQSLKIGSLQGLRVVLDLAWGSATALSAQVFESLDATVFCLHDRPDGERINVNCGSTHLRQLQQAVLELGADVGFAFDGDADRVLAVDHRGRTIDGDYILYLWGQHLAKQDQLPNQTIVTTVMANLGFERAWQQQGGTFLRTPVGDQYVQAEMNRCGAMLGGEQSGHILCRHYGLTGDGLLTALHLAELIHSQQTPLAELVDASFQTYPQLLRNVRVEDREKRLHWQDCEPLMAAIVQAEAEMGDAGRILVRASGTEPVIRVMVEAENAEDVQHYTDRLVAAVEQYLL